MNPIHEPCFWAVLVVVCEPMSQGAAAILTKYAKASNGGAVKEAHHRARNTMGQSMKKVVDGWRKKGKRGRRRGQKKSKPWSWKHPWVDEMKNFTKYWQLLMAKVGCLRRRCLGSHW